MVSDGDQDVIDGERDGADRTWDGVGRSTPADPVQLEGTTSLEDVAQVSSAHQHPTGHTTGDVDVDLDRHRDTHEQASMVAFSGQSRQRPTRTGEPSGWSHDSPRRAVSGSGRRTPRQGPGVAVDVATGVG